MYVDRYMSAPVIAIDRERSIAEARRLLEECGVPFSRIIRTGGGPGGEGVVYLRVNTYNVHALHKALDATGIRRAVDGKERGGRKE